MLERVRAQLRPAMRVTLLTRRKIPCHSKWQIRLKPLVANRPNDQRPLLSVVTGGFSLMKFRR